MHLGCYTKAKVNIFFIRLFPFFQNFIVLQSLDVHDWFDRVDDRCRVLYRLHDQVLVFIRHRGFIKGLSADGGGIDAFHFFREFVHIQCFQCFVSGKYPSGSMRGGTVPVRVTFSFANQQTVTHIEWDNHFFTLIGSNGSFSDDPVGRVDEIMHGVNRVHGLVIFTQVFEYGFW